MKLTRSVGHRVCPHPIHVLGRITPEKAGVRLSSQPSKRTVQGGSLTCSITTVKTAGFKNEKRASFITTVKTDRSRRKSQTERVRRNAIVSGLAAAPIGHRSVHVDESDHDRRTIRSDPM